MVCLSPFVTWFRNNSPFDPHKDPNKYEEEIDEVTGRVSLKVKNCNNEDEGEYTIKIENKAGNNHCSASLMLEKEPKKRERKVRFSLPKESDIFLFNPITQHAPYPPGEPTITDYKTKSLKLSWIQSPTDNRNYDEDLSQTPNIIPDNEELITYIVEFRNSKTYAWATYASNIRGLNLHVDNLIPGLIYSFRVRAENGFGISDASPAVSTKNLIDVDEKNKKKPDNDLSNKIQPFKKDRNMAGEKPTIVGETYDVRYYIEGETAIVTILVLGYPDPTVKWFRNDVEIQSTEPYKLHNDRLGYYTMEIAFASEKDEGPYQIVASNEHGTCSHTFYLQQADPPVFLEPFKDVTVQNHEDVTIMCKVDGIPYPEVKFYKELEAFD